MASVESVNSCEKAAEVSEKLSAAQRARAERNRVRARALREARLAAAPPGPALSAAAPPPAPAPCQPLDSGGGFLLEPETASVSPVRTRAPPAPLQPHEQPACELCQRRFAASYLLDTFDYCVCDDCRDEEGAHSLLTRTEAKTEFLLKDCDLDLRPPPLRCVRRPNPHRGARSDMRLYLRAQVEERALLVWGSEGALEEERAARGQRRAQARAAADRRRLRALRMDVRSSLYRRTAASHDHRWGPEAPAHDEDTFQRTCLDCGHTEIYEKM